MTDILHLDFKRKEIAIKSSAFKISGSYIQMDKCKYNSHKLCKYERSKTAFFKRATTNVFVTMWKVFKNSLMICIFASSFEIANLSSAHCARNGF